MLTYVCGIRLTRSQRDGWSAEGVCRCVAIGLNETPCKLLLETEYTSGSYVVQTCNQPVRSEVMR